MGTRAIFSGIVALAASLAFASAQAATLTVTTTADPSTADGACSLREAITSINAAANSGDCVASGTYNAGSGVPDVIDFNIAGAGVHTIALASSLPAITNTTTIDGYSQPGASANTNGAGLGSNAVLLIEIDATNVGNGAQTGALTVTGPFSGSTTIKGLVINRYVVSGIALTGSGSRGNLIQGNYIGVDPTGTVAMTSATAAGGIEINGSAVAPENFDTIGGSTPDTRNVIAGNNIFGQILFGGSLNSETTIEGNFIGTNAAGTASLSIVGCTSSAQSGIRTGAGTSHLTVLNNVISGNCARGINIVGDSSNNSINIEGNFIGTDVTGAVALGNQAEAIELSGVGDTISVLSNVISAAINTASNGTGLDISNGQNGSSLIQVFHNKIGTDVGGTLNLGNQGSGIVITNTSHVLISDNVIAFNGCCQLGGQPGVLINSGTGNVIAGDTSGAINSNSIFSNQTLGIDLAPVGVNPNNTATPANNGQNYPVITSASVSGGSVTIVGTISSSANQNYHLEFFSNAACDASGNGEGRAFLGTSNVMTDGAGSASFNVTFALSGGLVITSTASVGDGFGAVGDTSEFSACVTATGAAAPTTTALASSLNPSTFGQSVTFTATVTGSSPTGTVQFKDGASNLGAPVALSGGVATLATSSLGVGTHPITAVYGGDSGNLGSTSNTVDQVVNKAATTTALVSSLNPSTFGQSVTFTATVTGSSPTGTVQFKDGAANLGAPVSLAGATASFTTSSLAVGTHPITAVYGGDATNAGSTSSILNQVVNSSGATATTTTVVSSPNPSTVGQTVTFTATVNGNNPTGTVQFRDGGIDLGAPVAMSGGVATLTTSSFAAGTHPITAAYSGDAGNLASTSAILNQIVSSATAGTTAIPTLGAGALALMIVLLLLAGATALRRRADR